MKRIIISAAVAAVMLSASGDIRITLGLGARPLDGGPSRIRLVWDDPSIVPEIKPVETQFSRMDVITGEVTRVLFVRKDSGLYEYEYQFKPSPKVFTLTHLYRGNLYSITTWTYEDDGNVVMESKDPSGKVLTRSSRNEFKSEDGKRKTVRRMEGDVVHDKEYLNFPGWGDFCTFESWGTGENMRWERNTPYFDGIERAEVHSTLDSEGNWSIYEYELATGWTNSFRKTRITSNKGRAPAVTNETGLVTGWTGTAYVTELGYEGLEPEDDGTREVWTPRTSYKYELDSDGAVRPLSLDFFTEFVRGGECISIWERAATPNAQYGAAGNKRRIEAHEWHEWYSGAIKYEINEDGEKTVYDWNDFEIDGNYFRIKETYTTTPDKPGPVPYETVTTRDFTDDKGRLCRREHWIELEEGGKEMLDWHAWIRNLDGNVVKETTSTGRTVESEYYHHQLVKEKDDTGRESNYRYDAIDRMTHFDTPEWEENFSYDLASQVTNMTGSTFGWRHSMSMEYNNAGDLTDSKSDQGEDVVTKMAKDGSMETRINGVLAWTEVEEDRYTRTTYFGPKGRASPRWHKYRSDPGGMFYVIERPKTGGGIYAKTNYFEKAVTSRDVAKKPHAKYAKLRGVWWRETRSEDGSAVRRRLSGPEDGSSDIVYIDKSGNERRVETKVDRTSGESVKIITRAESALPSVEIASNGWTRLAVSFSGVTNRYEYGIQGRLESWQDGRGGRETRRYDEAGRLASKTDRNGRTYRYEYDERGRTSAIFSDALPLHRYHYGKTGKIIEETIGEETISYEYDEYGDITAIRSKDNSILNFYDEGTGLVTNRIVNGKATAFGYDDEGNLISVDGFDIRAAAAAFTNGLAIAKDAFGRPGSYSVEGKKKLSRSYDAKTGRIQAIRVEGIDGEAIICYLPGSDLMSRIEYPSGVIAEYAYNAEDELQEVRYLGLPGGDKIFKPKLKKSEIEQLFEESAKHDEVKEITLTQDKRRYLDFDNAFRNPIAIECEDGRVRWLILNADGEESGVME